MEKCSKCGAELNDLKINIRLDFSVNRLQDNGLWENIPNSILNPKEILCPNCFDDFVEAIGQVMNKK